MLEVFFIMAREPVRMLAGAQATTRYAGERQKLIAKKAFLEGVQ